MDAHMPLAEQATRTFAQRFGRPPQWLAIAPGRVNLIGEHTDYNDGFVLPMALDRHAVLAAAATQDATRLYSTAFDTEVMLPELDTPHSTLPSWVKYVQGVRAGFRAAGITPPHFQAVIHADVPLGGGLSSSAALEVATATLLEALAGVQLEPLQKALLCQQAEHLFAGVPCGIMDQCASIMCRADHALLLDCRSRQAKLIPFTAPDLLILIINSNVKHALTDGGYAARRQQCETAARKLGVPSLRDMTLAGLEAARGKLGDLLYRRARHVVTENDRTLQAAEALQRGDWETMGRLMVESHTSLREDYQVSCGELDILVHQAMELGPREGVIGSRMTGGGFGGCTVSLVRRSAASEVIQRICAGYQERTGRTATAFTTRPMDGARLWQGS
jgi:galactokinase